MHVSFFPPLDPAHRALAALAVLALIASGPGLARASSTEIASLANNEAQGNSPSDDPAVSADGRFVVFESIATNLVTGDTNNRRDIFVRDRLLGTTERVSLSTAGVQANDDCDDPVISADGRFVAFDTFADNLVAGDTNDRRDVFVRDLLNDTTTRVSVDTGGAQRARSSDNAAFSANGRYVGFEADRDGKFDVYVHDRDTTTTVNVSVNSAGVPGLVNNLHPSLSADGRFVAFDSKSGALVTGDTNGNFDVFVHDRDADEDGTFDEPGAIEVTRVSVTSAGAQVNNDSEEPSISGDGRYVVFESASNGIVPSDTNGSKDIFLHDRDTGTTIRISTNSAGNQSIGQDNVLPEISTDGRTVVYQSGATNLVAGDTNNRKDVFVYDRDTDNDAIFDEPGAVATIRASVSSADDQANDHSATFGGPMISGDGRFVVFESEATNLGGDTNNKRDAFLRDLPTCGNGITTGGEACDDGDLVSGDGCDENCTVTACGNDVDAGSEECDDGNLVSGDGCDANCTDTACGNDIVAGSEVCDDGNLTDGDGCDSNCTPTACGNGVRSPDEICDDGDLEDGDGCDSNCSVTGCGNGVLTTEEQCDDHNLVSGDGCDSNCTFTTCGNGIPTSGEECDDGDADPTDECKNDCTLNVCGDTIVHLGVEECDDGNAIPTDECKNDCTLNVCGDGSTHTGVEQCDDGDLDDGDGCDSNCTTTACGNGITTTGEACDDGDLVSGDGCDENCTATACGNAVVTTGETCDDGDLTDGDGCDSNCTPTGCGNSVQTSGEECDHGSENGVDRCCSGSCALVDADSDDLCDAEDLSDLSGLVVSLAQIKDTKDDPTKPVGVATVKGTFDPSSFPPSGAASFFAQAKLTGISLRLFAGAEPGPEDVPDVSLEFLASNCAFVEAAGVVKTVRCKRTIPPEGTSPSLQLSRKGTGYKLSAVLKKADIFAPDAGPVHAVIDLNDSSLLDHHGSVQPCKLSGSTRQSLKCKAP